MKRLKSHLALFMAMLFVVTESMPSDVWASETEKVSLESAVSESETTVAPSSDDTEFVESNSSDDTELVETDFPDDTETVVLASADTTEAVSPDTASDSLPQEAIDRLRTAVDTGAATVELSDLEIPYDDFDLITDQLESWRRQGDMWLSKGGSGANSYSNGTISCINTVTLSYCPELCYADGSLNMDTVKVEKYLYDRRWKEAEACVDSSMSDLEKVFAIHNWLVRNTNYSDVDDGAGNTSGSTWTIKGALVDGCIHCAGYAETMELLLNDLDIECEYVSSNAMNHAWNAVKLDGNWYMLDATWADGSSASHGKNKYNYFLKSDTEFSNPPSGTDSHHDWNEDAPDCTLSDSFLGYLFRTYGVEGAVTSNYDYLHYNMEYYDGYWYFTDGTAIKRAKIDGSDETVVYTDPDGKQLFDFYIYEGYAYFTDQSIIFRMPLADIADKTATAETYWDLSSDFSDGSFWYFSFENNRIMAEDPFEKSETPVQYVDKKNVNIEDSTHTIPLNTSWIITNTGTDTELQYLSSDTRVATVSSDGKVTAKKAGNATVLVYSDKGYDTVDITVPVMAGDVDGNGTTDSADLDLLLKYITNTAYFNDPAKNGGQDSTDVNGDGSTDIGDYVALAQIVNGANTVTPAETDDIGIALVSSRTDTIGDNGSVEVTLEITENSGLCGLSTDIAYDYSQLYLTEIRYGDYDLGESLLYPVKSMLGITDQRRLETI